MLNQEIRKRITSAMKSNNSVERDLLRLIISECMTECDRKAIPTKDMDQNDLVLVSTIKKVLKGVLTSLEGIKDSEGGREDLSAQLNQEKLILESLLPKELNQDDIREFIIKNNIIISSDIGEGRSMGNVIKAFKSQNISVNSEEVKAVVKSIIAN